MCPLPQLGRGCCDTQGPGWWSLAHTKGGGVHQKRVSVRLSMRPVYISFWRKWLWSPFCRGNMPYVHTAHISRTCASKEISRSVHTICRLSPRGAGFPLRPVHAVPSACRAGAVTHVPLQAGSFFEPRAAAPQSDLHPRQGVPSAPSSSSLPASPVVPRECGSISVSHSPLCPSVPGRFRLR